MRVLVVSFGVQEGAQMWLEQTGCRYDMLLDPQRKIYQAFGLGSSYAKVLKFSSLLQCGEYQVAKRSFPDIPYRLLEDLYQMGGDFILNQEGKVLLSRPCMYPLDRPVLQDLLQAITGSGSSISS